ncbi:hypothetical protein PQ472_02265 [Lacticaseibacillus pabuli]|uniref:YD repeat-containing protein n=1 Tax=Lacticaseibacillus pabuli TaxID=3025672 RepID=A0ABY7WVS7_9LACO|nr:hypothetical protein [Lacticaseibacillus sp. KACC 23028]WDF83077.1 hypothetical protein PQ472_02265 [Lacticaseibacillus sp. KACC 23028]
MNYELINQIGLGTPAWQTQKKRIEQDNRTLLTLTSMPRFSEVLKNEKVKGVNLIDHLTGRTYDPDGYRFFNDVPVPETAQIFMNGDGSISIINDGEEIAKEFLFSGTRRQAQDVRYENLDGSLDYIHEFEIDGSTFSNIFYYNDDMQEIAFMDNDENVHVRFFYYNGAINLITVEDPQSHKTVAKYDTLNQFLAAEVAKMTNADDTVTITYLGLELDAVSQTKAHTVLDMVESPWDDAGNVRGNLLAILEGRLSYVDEVLVNQADYDRLQREGVATAKLTVVDK